MVRTVSVLRVRIEPGIPKLLVKINPQEAEIFGAKNLGEVTLRKVSIVRGQVAVLHLSRNIPPGEVLMSVKLADLLDVEDDETIEVTASQPAGAGAGLGGSPGAAPWMPRTAAKEAAGGERPAPPAGPSRFANTATPREAPGGAAEHWGSSRQPRPPQSARPDRQQEDAAKGARSFFDADWFHSLEREQATRRPRDRRSNDAFAGIGERRPWEAHWPPTSAPSWPPPPEAEATPLLGSQRAAASPPSAAADWLRGLRSSAERYEEETPRDFGFLGRAASFQMGTNGRTGSGHEAARRNFASNGNFHGDWNCGPSGTSAGESRHRYGAAQHDGPSIGGTTDLGGQGRPAPERTMFRADNPFVGLDDHIESSVGRGMFSWCDDEPEQQPPSHAEWQEPRPGTLRYGERSRASRGSTPAEVRPSEPRDLHASPPRWSAHRKLPGQAPSNAPCNAHLPEVEVRAGYGRAGRADPWIDKPQHDHYMFPAVDSLPASDGSGDEADVLRCLTGRHGQRVGSTATGGPSGSSMSGQGRAPQRSGISRWSVDPSTLNWRGPPHRGTSAWTRSTSESGVQALAESLQPSPLPSRTASQTSSRATSRTSSHTSPAPCPFSRVASGGRGGAASVLLQEGVPPLKARKAKGFGVSPPSSCGGASSSPSTAHTPRVSSTPTSVPSEGEAGSGNEPTVLTELPSPVQMPLALVPFQSAAPVAPSAASARPEPQAPQRRGNGGAGHSRALGRRRTSTLGSLQPDVAPSPVKDARQPLPHHWLPPVDALGGGLERSELGGETTAEVRRWLLGETSGPQCSQVVLDRALTVLSNFKLSSGCQLEVLGGPLGAIVGGYSDADWLLDEVFGKQPGEAVRDAFANLGFRERLAGTGDWSNVAADEISLAYRRMCLRGHPSRGGSPRGYLKMQVAMELVRAFCGEAGPLAPNANGPEGFVLNDLALAHELELTPAQAEAEAGQLPQEELEEMNRALDEYILRQMCFKSEIVDEIARLHEDSAYAILGVSSGATDSEIKKAYRLIAMQCHPDKGGDKEEFQQLHNAYEKIMEQRRSTHADDKWGKEDDHVDSPRKQTPETASKKNASKAQEADAAGAQGKGEGGEDGEGKAPGAGQTGGKDNGEASDSSLVEKAGKAAEEASRYAKTAAEFAHQAAEAAEAARRDRERGSRDSLTKSTAHSAIVYTLTVVKAVRAVGYATLDVAAQCRAAAKRNPAATGCAERAVAAMSLGLEALNAALACAEVTETTAAELQQPSKEEEPEGLGCGEAAERFVGAAVRASLAAASASNAAMSAAIAAVEGSRQCVKAMERRAETSAAPEAGEDGEAGTSNGGEDGESGPTAAPEASSDEAEHKEEPQRRRPPTAEEAAAAAAKRSVAQRNNNHKVLQRLNAEILAHQRNVRQFLQANRQLIPQVSGEAKQKIFGLLRDYALEARAELEGTVAAAALEAPDGNAGGAAAKALVTAMSELPLLVPFLQPQSLAIPVCVKARVLKMAALYDLTLTMQVLQNEVFTPALSALPPDVGEGTVATAARRRADELCARVREELSSNVAEPGATDAPVGEQIPAASCCGQTTPATTTASGRSFRSQSSSASM